MSQPQQPASMTEINRWIKPDNIKTEIRHQQTCVKYWDYSPEESDQQPVLDLRHWSCLTYCNFALCMLGILLTPGFLPARQDFLQVDYDVLYCVLVTPGFLPARQDFLQVDYDVLYCVLVTPWFLPARQDFLQGDYDVLYCDTIFHQPVFIPEHNLNTDYCENLKSSIFYISIVWIR